MSYPEFTPDLFNEHFDDGRALDNEIDDSPRMLWDPGYELPVSHEIVGEFMVGAEQTAILATLARARDNRRPCPPMKAVDLDAPLPYEEEDALGAAVSEAPAAFPLTLSLIEAYRAAGKPRIVRVDTEESYQAFRDSSSPERMALLARLARVEEKLSAHISDPDAHTPGELDEAIGEVVDLEDAVCAVEADKQIPLRMPKHFDGLMTAWHEGGMAAGSMYLPRLDGGRWVVTASEPVETGELEVAKAAVEAGVPAAAIVGYLPAIGASLAQADAIKALASGATGAESILARPEASGKEPFLVRLEPQVSPALFALAELLCLCQLGNPAACAEWTQLAQAAPLPVRQAMAEIQAALRPPAQTTIGGAVGDFFSGLWQRVRHFLHLGKPGKPASTPMLPSAATPKALPQRASA